MRGYYLAVFWMFALVGCQATPEASSSPRVTNGRVALPSEYPAVVQLYREISELLTGHCTGSFVTPQIILTAAHCARGEVDKNGFVIDTMVRFDGKAPKRIFRNKAWAPDAMDRHRFDLALVELAEPVKSNEVLVISQSRAKVGDHVNLVGFGLADVEDPSGYGTKRIGENVLTAVEGDLLKFDGQLNGSSLDGVDSASASGDSGGPLLLDGRIVGTTAAGSVEGGRKKSFYTDLHSPISKAFFADAAKEGVIVPLPEDYLQDEATANPDSTATTDQGFDNTASHGGNNTP